MTTLADPVPKGHPGDVERATALEGELSGRGVHGIVPAYGDTAGTGRVQAKPAYGATRQVELSGCEQVYLDVVDADELSLPDALRIAEWTGSANAAARTDFPPQPSPVATERASIPESMIKQCLI